MFDLSQLDPEKLRMLAQEWDPTPFLQASESVTAPQEGGAMDMYGSAAYPQGAPPAAGMDYATIFGGASAPKMAGMSPFPAAMMAGMQTKPTPMSPAPAAAPRAGSIPNLNLGRGVKPVPSFAELLKGGFK